MKSSRIADTATGDGEAVGTLDGRGMTVTDVVRLAGSAARPVRLRSARGAGTTAGTDILRGTA
ncbi:hypothetical protein [Streptomyces sp. NPDC058308]|uniref:hypothetical protein n=1 Tax=Streptomyces sp. NPDC058308 TaxID=3346440 RepID=UPI0036F0C6DE